MTDLPDNWADARRLEAKTYFTGRACKYGHVAERNTTDASCRACRQVMAEAARPRMAAYMRKKRAAMLAADRESTLTLWRENNRLLREKHAERYRQRDRDRGPERRKKERLKRLADCRARQCAQKQRTPKWADLRAIKLFYEACPTGHEVDHVVPLQGKTVSGLHVIENLQYLPAFANRTKGRTFNG